MTDESRQVQRGDRKARQTKSGRSRSFPIHAELKAVLRALPETGDGLLFHGSHGGKLKPDKVRYALIRDAIEPLAGRFPSPPGETGFKDGRLHSFRHYFCSTCANGNTPEQVVMEWLGHRDSRMVRRYYHLHHAEAQRQMEKLDFLSDGASNVAGGGTPGLVQEVTGAET